MRYDDASQTGSMAQAEPVARPDVDNLPPGSFGPATGNAISGAGTTSGTSGADTVGAAPASIIEVHGAGGQTVQANGAFQAIGQYGVLSMDAQGDFQYVRNAGTPDGVQDVFNYTIADASGANASTTLTIDIGQVAAAAAGQGIVNLPPGVELSDIHVNGRDLVIDMPDGTQMVIPGGAVFVPQLMIGDVQVPPTNLAALLIDSEPQPAAGPPQSSGGNFAEPVPPLDPGAPLGDLIPPTELSYTPPEFEELANAIDKHPIGGATSAVLDDDAQPGGIAGGVGDDPGGSSASGLLPGSDGDGNLTWDLLPTGAPAGFSYADGPNGSVLVFQDGNPDAVLSITINPETGEYTVTQLGPIAHPAGGDENNVELVINYTVTDEDGDTAPGSLTINVDDDTPVARNDTDAVPQGQDHTDGNVLTGVGTTSGSAGADSGGADGITAGVIGIHPGTTGSFTAVDADGVTVAGTFGDLLIHSDGSYTYTLHDNVGNGGTEVFTYEIIDDDGDPATATLTITVPANLPPPDTIPEVLSTDDALVDEDGLQNANVDNGQINPTEVDSTESATDTGSLVVDFKTDVPANLATAITLQATGLDGQLETPDGTPITFSVNGLGQLVGSDGTNDVIIISITGVTAGSGGQATYTYEVELKGPVQHVDPNSEDTITLNGVSFEITDSNGDHASGSFNVDIVDDVPTAGVADQDLPSITLDESALGTDTSDGTLPNGIASDTVDFSGAFNAPVFGADGEGSVKYSLDLSAGPVGSGLYALDASDTDGVGVDGDGIGQGDEIMLVQNLDGSISGVVGTDVYFTISVDENTGEVTFSQALNIWHPDTTNNDDAQSIVPNGGTLDLVQTVTDGDGDVDTASVDLSGAFTIQDDGPTGGTPDSEGLPTLVVDESPLGLDEGGDNDPAGVRTATADFSGAFGGGDPGTDGLGSVHYALSLHGQALGSGLYALDNTDTQDVGDDGDGIGQGDEIMLVDNGDGTISGMANGTEYFVISVDENTGEVTFEQTANVWHADTGSDDDTSSLVAADGTITLDQIITDADGDHVSASVDLSDGIFNIEDDGPNAVADAEPDLPQLVVDESPLPTDGDGDNSDTQNFATAFAAVLDYGTDGPGSEHYALILNGDQQAGIGSGLYALDASDTDGIGVDGDGIGQGDEILLVQNLDGSISGVIGTDVYFTISVDADTGDVTLTRDPNDAGLNLWHGDTSSADDQEVLTAVENTIQLQQTLTDADGDSDSAVVDLSAGVFVFEDDGPNAGTSGDNPPTITLDESPPPTAGDGDSSNSADFSTLFATPTDFGTDGPGSVAYSLLVTPSSQGGTVGSGLYALDATDTDDGGDGDGYGQGDEILLVQTDADTITGTVNGIDYFTIDVDPTTGQVTFTQLNNIWHSDPTNPDDSESLIASGGTLQIVQTVTDADGDTSTASADISGAFAIEDDGPSAIQPDSVNIEQNGTVTGIELDLAGPGGDAAGVGDNYGTDGAGTVRFPSTLEGSDSGLTSGGAAILYHLVDDQTLVGYVEDGTNTGFQDGEDATILTITLHPGSSTYDVALSGTIDSNTTINFNDGSYDFVGGNDPWAGFVPLGQIDGKQNNTPLDDNSQDLLITPFSPTGDGDAINGNANSYGTSGGGGGQNVGFGEGIRLDFVTDLTGNPAGNPANYDGNVAQQDHVFDGHYLVNDVSVRFGDGTGDSTVKIEAFDNVDNVNDAVLGQGDLVNITQIIISYDGENQAFNFDSNNLTQTLTVGSAGGLPDRQYTVEWIQDSPGVYHVEVTGILDTNVRIATHGETQYQALELENVSIDDPALDWAITGLGAVTQSTDPVPFSVPVEIVDADGDTAVGSLDVTVYPVGDLPVTTLSTLSTASFLSTSSFDTSSLISSNDNKGGHDNNRAFNAGSNSVLMGALAAAGLSGLPSAAAAHASVEGSHHSADLSSHTAGLSVQQQSGGGGGHGHSYSSLLQASNQASDTEDKGHSARGHAADHAQSDSPDGGDHQQGPAELLQGTDAPAHGGAAATQVTAPTVVMPTAEQLAGAGHEQPASVDANAPQHNEVVGKVLADALHGGEGHGPNIDALIDGLAGSGHGHANQALEALASHGAGAVPFGHMGFAGAFGGLHSMHFDAAMHQDAAPTHG